MMVVGFTVGARWHLLPSLDTVRKHSRGRFGSRGDIFEHQPDTDAFWNRAIAFTGMVDAAAVERKVSPWLVTARQRTQ